jgi:hypothetical protein
LVYKALELAEKVSDKNILTIVFDSVAKYGQTYQPIWDIDFCCGTALATPAAMNMESLVAV